MRQLSIVASLLFALILLSTVHAQATDPVVYKPNPSINQSWKSGWNKDEANWYHHASQGTMLLPYDWFMALEQPATISSRELKMFSDPAYLNQFGFLASEQHDKYNPGNLPIGFAITNDWVDPNNTTPKPPVRALGLTCAACHTGEISYKGTRLRIEGGSAMINIGAFQTAMAQALNITNSDSDKFQAFAKRWFPSQNLPTAYEERARAALKDELGKAVTKISAEKKLETELGPPSVDAGFARTDAMARIGNKVFGKLGKVNLKQTNAPVNFPHIWDTSWFYWVQYNASIRLPMVRNIGQALGVGAAINEHYESTVNVENLHLMEDQLSGKTPFSGLQAPAWPEEILGEINGFKTADKLWKKGKTLYEQHCIQCHYRIEDYQRTEHIDREESKEFWTKPNQFGSKYMKLPFINFADIGTDPAAVIDFYQRIVYTGSVQEEKSTMSAGAALTAVTAGVRNYEYTRLNLSAAAQAEYDGYREINGEEAAIARLEYKARPLNGIWATAPFLHNGSVANLYELLLPAKQRAKNFHLGSTEFDPKKVGFSTDWKEGSFQMDTTIAGNLNSGHEFRDLTQEELSQFTAFQKGKLNEAGWAVAGRIGPELKDDDRWALIEYVKSLGSPQLGQERAPAGEQQAIRLLAQLQGLIHRSNPGPDGKSHPEKRAQHPKGYGVVTARFRIADKLDDRYRIGIFKDPKEYVATIRFSAGDAENDDDRKPDIHGMAIKLLLDSKKSQDFVLADNETFFAHDVEHLVQFVGAILRTPKEKQDEAKMKLAVTTHKGLQGFKKLLTTSPLQATYYSQTPYKFGDGAAKYRVAPSSTANSSTSETVGKAPAIQFDPSGLSKDFLSDALIKRLSTGSEPVSLDFFVQLQTDAKKMPIEDATVKWDSQFVKLATITIEPQKIDPSFGESIVFSPWNAIADHLPLGGINRARKGIYEDSVKLREKVQAQQKTAPANPVRLKGELKKDDFGYSLPIDKPLYPAFPYKYKDCTIVTYEYETDPVAAARFLPAQLTVDEKPRVKMLFAHYPSSDLGPYNEVAQSLICQYVEQNGQVYKDKSGNPVEFSYPLRMHVTSDRAMAAGREIAGIPKKMGSIQFLAREKYFSYLDDAEGKRVCSGTMNAEKQLLQIKSIEAAIPLSYVSIRIVPSATDNMKPKVCELLASTWKLGPGEMSVGTGTLSLEPSDLDPYHRLPVVKVTKCLVYRGDMEATSLQVLSEF